MTIKFQHQDIHFTSIGSGPLLVLLHGFLESREIWQPFLSDLREKFQVLTIDLPGHGQSGCLSQAHTMESMAESVLKVMDHLELCKAHFIGHSMGGYVALALLENWPHRIKQITLMNSSPAADTVERRNHRERSIRMVRQNKKRFISMAITNLLRKENHLKFKRELDMLKQRAANFPTEGITAALQGMKIRKDRTEVLQQFQGKKIILTGQDDPLIPINHVISVARLCDCQLFQLSGGHLGYLEGDMDWIELCT